MALGKLAFFSFAVAAAGSPDSNGVAVTLHKVGFPESYVRQRPACGEMNTTKSLLNPTYWMHVMFGGFREGSCSSAGYKTFEDAESIYDKLPFRRGSNTTFNVFTRDPNGVDVASCMLRNCKSQMESIVSSGYTKDVARCIGPAFGPCVPKAWDCLGDTKCRTAVKCVPEVAAKCGGDIMKVLEDKTEREKLLCIEQCKGDKICVLTKCGRAAVSCLIGTDALCYQALMCIPKGLTSCSVDAFECLFSSSSICRDNLKCFASGANTCADPAVNALTDTSFADLVTCANEQCPAPEAIHEEQPKSDVEAAVAKFDAGSLSLPHYPTQLACMGLHCTTKVIDLLFDKDVAGLTNCLPRAIENCGPSVWQCTGDERCLANFRCWTQGLSAAAGDMWNMLTDSTQRKFDQELFDCVVGCSKDKNPFQRVACLAGKCGLKAAKCMTDAPCRKLLADLPLTAARCGPASVKDLLNKNTTFSKALFCGVRVAEDCGTQGVELLRDLNVADLLHCNAQCTRAPGNTTAEATDAEALIVV